MLSAGPVDVLGNPSPTTTNQTNCSHCVSFTELSESTARALEMDTQQPRI